MGDLTTINSKWTLFLDRDGVINHEKKMDYIYRWNEFEFYEGVTEALKMLSEVFGPIIMVTNQRGVGKGLMTEKDLSDIHTKMTTSIKKAGGRLDKIYYCTSLDNSHPDRKPNTGMALAARKDIPAIEFAHSVMVGNNLSDMDFGKRCGMHTILLTTTSDGVTLPNPLVDHQFSSLLEFAHFVIRSS